MLLWLQVLEIRMQILKLNKQGDVQEKLTAYIKVSNLILIITSYALSN